MNYITSQSYHTLNHWQSNKKKGGTVCGLGIALYNTTVAGLGIAEYNTTVAGLGVVHLDKTVIGLGIKEEAEE